MKTYSSSLIFQVLFLVSHLLRASVTEFVTKNVNKETELSSKIRVQKQNYIRMCEIGNIVRIILPKHSKRNEIYYLHKPNGDVRTIKSYEMPKSNDTHSNQKSNKSSESMKQRNYENSVVVDVFDDTAVLAEEEENKMFIGPLFDSDHGNWVLSKFYMNDRSEVVEEFMTISLIIIEKILQMKRVKLSKGDTFKPSFPQPILHLESCQLIAPIALVDRAYEKNPENPRHCGYIVRNVTEHDSGSWRILAVGKIVYTTEIDLKVK